MLQRPRPKSGDYRADIRGCKEKIQFNNDSPILYIFDRPVERKGTKRDDC
jgi:hypothetical protein